MLRAQLHMHTIASKGTRIEYDSVINPDQAIDILSKNGINVVVVTDHNTTRAYDLMKKFGERKEVYVIRGIEINTLDGHIIGLGVAKGIDQKLKNLGSRLTVFEAVDLIRDFNGEIYIPHPFDIQKKGLRAKIFEISGIVEIFNPMNIFGFENELANKIASKLGKPKAVGADAHTSALLSTCITCIDSELNEDSILRSLRKGRVSFENCRYMSLMEMMKLILRRMQLSYQSMMHKVTYGWETDTWYMKIANNWLMRKVEKEALRLGVKKPNSRVWDSVSILAYVIATIYAKQREKEFRELINDSFIFHKISS